MRRRTLPGVSVMTDHTITAVIAAATGVSVYAQAEAVQIPLPLSAMLSIIGMASAAFVTWGMFKKASERNEAEIELLRQGLGEIQHTLSDVRERVSRIEGKLEGSKHD